MQENWDDCVAIVIPSLLEDGKFEVVCFCGYQSKPLTAEAAHILASSHEKAPSPIIRGAE